MYFFHLRYSAQISIFFLKVGSSKYLGNYYPLDIKDDYHILDNEIHQFYYKQSIYKGFILLKLTFKFLTLQSAKE
jgi:hypothetical protein